MIDQVEMALVTGMLCLMAGTLLVGFSRPCGGCCTRGGSTGGGICRPTTSGACARRGFFCCWRRSA